VALPTWAELLRRPAVVGAAAGLVLLADLLAVTHVRDGRSRCASGRSLPPSSLTATLELDGAVRSAGHDLFGEASVVNGSTRSLLLLRAEGVLLAPGTRQVLTWGEAVAPEPVELGPGSLARVPFVVHLARCERGHPDLQPGFYELALVLEEGDRDGHHRRVSPSRTVVVPP
jgi:hypothetical protein